MKKKMRISLVVALLVLLVIGAYILWDGRRNSNELILFGNVDIRQVDLGFRVAGRVENLYFQEGDLVRAGSLMATLEREPYGDEHLQAEAQAESAKFTYENTEKLLKRRNALQSDGGVSQEDFQTSETNKDVALAAVKAAAAAVGVAKKNLTDTNLYCPTDGTILSRVREPGSVVSPTDPVYTLSILSPLWIRAYVQEPDLGRIYPGMEGEVFTDTKSTPVYKGKIGFISPVAEFTPKTVETASLRTSLVYRIRLYIDHPGPELRQGMPVTIKFPHG